jgi:hypothetical protein
VTTERVAGFGTALLAVVGAGTALVAGAAIATRPGGTAATALRTLLVAGGLGLVVAAWLVRTERVDPGPVLSVCGAAAAASSLGYTSATTETAWLSYAGLAAVGSVYLGAALVVASEVRERGSDTT